MGMYDTLNDEQVKCFPWYSFDVISLSPEGSIGGHGGKLKYYGNGSEIPYRSPWPDEDNLERVSIAGVNGGNKYLSKNEDVYGVIQRTVLYEDINDPTELLKEAQKYIDIYSVPYSSYTNISHRPT